jgi:hypothetical protein
LTDRAERGDEWARRTWKGVGADGIGAEAEFTFRLIVLDVSGTCRYFADLVIVQLTVGARLQS